MSLPSYNVLPAPLWLITTLHLLTLTLHFAAMNFIVGGLIFVLSARSQSRWSSPLVGRFVHLFPVVMAATVTMGVAPLLFLQLVYGRGVYAASIVSGWFWLLIICAVIIGYYALYGASLSQSPSRRGLFLSAALIGVIYVSLVYSSVFALVERPALMKELYTRTQSGLVWNPQVKDYVLRWLHMILGALTLGGFFALVLAKDDPAARKRAGGFFLWGVVFGFLSGLAYLFSLGDIMRPFMRSPAIWVLTLGIVLTMLSVFLYHRRSLFGAGIALFLSMLAMVFSRHWVRLIRLEGHLDPAAIPVQPQWGVFGIFLACFAATIGLSAWMLRLFFRRAEPQ